MNIEELKEGQKILVECEFDSLAGGNQAWVLIQGEGELVQLDSIKPYQPKPVVPQFVAEWIEKYKEKGCRLSHALKHVFDDVELGLYIKQREDDYTEIIAKAWLYGYTVEKEKLYTVEIPNPNAKGHNKIYLCKADNTGKVYLCKGNFNPRKNKNLWLTEQEIRKDFDWAWQWKKEVRE